MNEFIIYKITNKINGKIYVGQTVNLAQRKRQYKHVSKNPKYYIDRAMAKYGFENFKFDIIWKSKNIDEQNKMEKFWIAIYNSTNPVIGYNICAGGEGIVGKIHSKESKLKMSIAKKGKHYSTATEFKIGNKSWNEGTIGVMLSNSGSFTSEKLKNVPKSREHVNKIAKSNTGKKRTDENKLKLSKAKLGRTWKLIDGKRVWSPRNDKV